MAEDEGGGTTHAFDAAHPTVPHYYGDVVRRIFVVAAVALLFTSPFLGQGAFIALPAAVAGALGLASLAALTSPRKRWVMVANAAVSAVCILIAEIFAVESWNAGASLAFFISEALALSFLFALYFSMKTVRAMFLKQIGRKPTVGEFLE